MDQRQGGKFIKKSHDIVTLVQLRCRKWISRFANVEWVSGRHQKERVAIKFRSIPSTWHTVQINLYSIYLAYSIDIQIYQSQQIIELHGRQEQERYQDRQKRKRFRIVGILTYPLDEEDKILLSTRWDSLIKINRKLST